jgi:hypothetical protein
MMAPIDPGERGGRIGQNQLFSTVSPGGGKRGGPAWPHSSPGFPALPVGFPAIFLRQLLRWPHSMGTKKGLEDRSPSSPLRGAPRQAA